MQTYICVYIYTHIYLFIRFLDFYTQAHTQTEIYIYIYIHTHIYSNVRIPLHTEHTHRETCKRMRAHRQTVAHPFSSRLQKH